MTSVGASDNSKELLEPSAKQSDDEKGRLRLRGTKGRYTTQDRERYFGKPASSLPVTAGLDKQKEYKELCRFNYLLTGELLRGASNIIVHPFP